MVKYSKWIQFSRKLQPKRKYSDSELLRSIRNTKSKADVQKLKKYLDKLKNKTKRG